MNFRRHLLNGILWTTSAWVLVEVIERSPWVLLLIPLAAFFSWFDTLVDKNIAAADDLERRLAEHSQRLDEHRAYIRARRGEISDGPPA